MIFINTDLSHFKILELTKRIKIQWIRSLYGLQITVDRIGLIFG